MVTNQPSEKVKVFLKTHSIPFPFIAEDTLLSKFFPHVYLSHEVWIKDGVVKAITHTEYVTDANIESMLSGKKISWPVKRDESTFDYSKPLLHINEETVPDLSYPSSLYYSMFSNCLNNIPPMYKVKNDSTTKSLRVSIINMPVIDLYLRSYSMYRIAESHIILEVKDTSRYVYNKAAGFKEDWREHFTYCYEAVFPSPVPGEKIRADLDMYLGLHGRIEKRLVRCLVLVVKDSLAASKLVYSTKPVPGMISLSNLIYEMDHTYSGIPAIDETGFTQHAWLKDENNLRAYGLELVPQERMMDMLIITENK